MGQVADPRGAGEVPAAGSTERMALHPYPVCFSDPIKRAPLSGAKQVQCPGTGSGHAGFFCLGGNPNGKVGQLLSSLHPKLYLHITLINDASYWDTMWVWHTDKRFTRPISLQLHSLKRQGRGWDRINTLPPPSSPSQQRHKEYEVTCEGGRAGNWHLIPRLGSSRKTAQRRNLGTSPATPALTPPQGPRAARRARLLREGPAGGDGPGPQFARPRGLAHPPPTSR